jgi:hypothetical protein
MVSIQGRPSEFHFCPPQRSEQLLLPWKANILNAVTEAQQPNLLHFTHSHSSVPQHLNCTQDFFRTLWSFVLIKIKIRTDFLF